MSLYLRYTRIASSCSFSSLLNFCFACLLLSSGSISEGYKVKKLSSIVFPLFPISLKIKSLTLESCWFFVSRNIILVNSISIWIWLAKRFTNEVYSGGKLIVLFLESSISAIWLLWTGISSFSSSISSIIVFSIKEGWSVLEGLAIDLSFIVKGAYSKWENSFLLLEIISEIWLCLRFLNYLIIFSTLLRPASMELLTLFTFYLNNTNSFWLISTPSNTNSP